MSDQIIVFRPGALGDTIVTADALRALRTRFPAASVELIGNAPAGRLLRDAGFVDRVTSFDALDVAGLFTSVPKVPERWRNAAVAVVWLRSSEPVVRALQSVAVSQIVVAPPEPAEPGRHISDHLLATLGPLGVGAPTGVEIALLQGICGGYTPPDEARRALVHPGSGSKRKNWPAAEFAGLVRELGAEGWDVSVLSGPADAAALADVRPTLPHDVVVRQPVDLSALTHELCAASLFVGNDSGVTHVSARLGLRTVAMFGATDPGRWGPRGPRVVVVGGLGSWPSLPDVLQAIRSLCARADPDARA